MLAGEQIPEGRIGPPRAVATGLLTERQVWFGTAVTLGLAVSGGIYLTAIAGWVVVAIGIAAILAAMTYTGGPAPYGYAALGEVSVFVFFGLAATVGSRYVHDRTAPLDAWLLAVPVGMLVTAILVANNVRDLDTDRAAAKRTLAVVLGRTATRRLYTALVVGAFAALSGFVIAGWVPMGRCPRPDGGSDGISARADGHPPSRGPGAHRSSQSQRPPPCRLRDLGGSRRRHIGASGGRDSDREDSSRRCPRPTK